MRAGQTLHEAIITASRGDYGTLTPEIKKMARQITWGVPATRALEMFSKRLPTPLVKRSVTLIIRANEAGGNISSVLEAAANDAREIQLMKLNRKIAMGEYTLVILVSFFVFLAVIAIIFMQFVPPMKELAESYGKGGGLSGGMSTFNPQNVDFNKIRLLFLLAALIQAVGDGIVAGIMSQGSIVHGAKLSVGMVIPVLLTFMFFL
ncbi:MAG: type II secretion system F family protein [Thermoplasmata archaeon]|nr:type II secretion system F family protein [Thermoplasmata archaeon]